MLKRIVFTALCSLFVFGAIAQSKLPMVIAHNGCWIESSVPENTPAAISLAAKMGYQAVSMDVKSTKDGELVCLSDETINRTLRRADGYQELTGEMFVNQMELNDLRSHYVIASENVKLRKPIPTLEEMLKICKKSHLIPMVCTSSIEACRMTQKLFKDNWICCTESDSLALAVREFSNCEILVEMSEREPQAVIKRLQKIGGKCGVSITDRSALTESFCIQLRANGFEVQTALLIFPFEQRAIENGATRVLSDYVFPFEQKRKPSDTWGFQGQILPAVSEYEQQWDSCAYGGMTIHLWFRGTIYVIINGEKKYSLTSTGEKMQEISTRFANVAPKIRVVSAGETQMAEMDLKVYLFK